MADAHSPASAGPRRRVGRPTAAARRDRLRGRERQAAHMAARIVEQLERTVGEQDRAAPREVDTDEEEEDYYERPRYTGPFAKLLEMSG